ncbi:MAG: RDD family protein [Pseudomonadota bacterium]
MKLWRRKRKGTRRGLITDFMPPEGVPLIFQVAPLGARAMAQTIDLLLTLAFAASFVGLLALSLNAPWALLQTLGALIFFAIRTPYYVITELLWQGRTLGKSITGLRVISADGRSLGAKAIAIRNLMKEAEVFTPLTLLAVAQDLSPFWRIVTVVWLGCIIAVPLLSPKRQRIGDIAADTVVIAEPKALLLPDLAAAPVEAAAERFPFLPHNLEHYGVYELQTLEGLLHAPPTVSHAAAERRAQTLASVVEMIRRKIDYAEAVPQHEHDAFLKAFYVAQRRHLEQRQLMGERRADKFHKQTPAVSGTEPS